MVQKSPLRLAAFCALVVVGVGGIAALLAQEHSTQPSKTPSISVFEFPRIVETQRAIVALEQLGDTAKAGSLLNALVEKYSSLPGLHAELAALQLRQGEKSKAIDSLKQAIALGLPKAALERDPAFQDLREDPAFEQLMTTENPAPAPEVRSLEPQVISDEVALVGPDNTAWDPRMEMLRSFFRFQTSAPKNRAVANDSVVSDRLNAWFLQGTGAGNYGDLYDNRDGRHSVLPPEAFPQLTGVQYSAEAQQAGLDRSLNRYLIFNTPTIGNASLAVTGGPLWRSLPRTALTDPNQVARLFWEYAANQIYVYPAHEDYGRTHGDVITANTPYMLISVGSSGSDQPLLKAVASILGAFRPEVKSFLVRNGLIAPTVQWIFRRGQFDINTDEDYLSGRAHPSAFDGKRLNPLDMIERAHSLDVSEVPPMVRLRVKEENSGDGNAAAMLTAASETLFDTPSAIARVFRSTAYAKRMVVDASETTDPNGRELTFRWSVLRGNKNLVTVRPLNKAGSVAEIVIPWDAGVQPAGGPNITGDRVEVGVFANNGKNWSAPAFVSVLFPGNERRIYGAGGRIAEVDYDDPSYSGRYVDPLLFPLRDWHDQYVYDKSGQLLGWTRTRGDATSRFTWDGKRVVERDSLGRPLKAEEIRYQLRRQADERMKELEVPTGNFVSYTYKDDKDFSGVSAPAAPTRK